MTTRSRFLSRVYTTIRTSLRRRPFGERSGRASTDGVPVYQARAEPISQGDIFADVAFVFPVAGEASLTPMLRAVVISHDCDCDKAATRREDAAPDMVLVSVAPVYPMDYLSGGMPGDVRAGRIRRYMHLPAEAHPEQVVDLALIQPAPVQMLLRSARVASLSDDYRGRLLLQIGILLERRKPVRPAEGSR